MIGPAALSQPRTRLGIFSFVDRLYMVCSDLLVCFGSRRESWSVNLLMSLLKSFRKHALMDLTRPTEKLSWSKRLAGLTKTGFFFFFFVRIGYGILSVGLSFFFPPFILLF